ncbi:MAG: COG1615 family transporter, partial [Candidatus Latescibacteria bacterium]|nr:COG1615 family transporter [Candidatus Latescibacterota bacterium]
MTRSRAIILGIIGVIFFLWLSVGFWANIYVEALWFDQLNYGDVFWTTFGARFFIGFIFGLVAVVIVGLNLFLARHYSSRLTELHLFNEEANELEKLFS